jgi:hypothetical protein
VSPDGQQFLMVKAPGTNGGLAPSALIVVQHWDEELKRLVPTKLARKFASEGWR